MLGGGCNTWCNLCGRGGVCGRRVDVIHSVVSVVVGVGGVLVLSVLLNLREHIQKLLVV